jgi:predicted metal-dependent phosphoesterase TrpH
LLLNFRHGAEAVQTFDDLAKLRLREPGLVIAPHPFFPGASCLGSDLERHAELFDAVEWNAMFTRQANFNRRAERWAVRHGRPIVGNGDIHRLRQLGTCYSMVDAAPDVDAICDAVRAGRVQRQARPLAWHEVVSTMTSLFLAPHPPPLEQAAPAQSRPQLVS